ncbi:MAG: hypothetical protein V5788_00540 [Shewanella sp.]
MQIAKNVKIALAREDEKGIIGALRAAKSLGGLGLTFFEPFNQRAAAKMGHLINFL